MGAAGIETVEEISEELTAATVVVSTGVDRMRRVLPPGKIIWGCNMSRIVLPLAAEQAGLWAMVVRMALREKADPYKGHEGLVNIGK